MNHLIALLGGVRATVFAGAALLLLVLVGVQSWRLDAAQDDAEEAAANAVAAELAATQAARDREAEWYTAVYDITFNLESKRLKRESDTDRTISCLRDGSCRLRDRFTCPRLPAAAQAAGRGDDADAGGLRIDDAEFLVRLADRADAVAEKLAACQAYAESVSGAR